MPRGYNNYSYVVPSSFNPFSMQEMLVPFTAYKQEFDKQEEAYLDLTKQANKFEYLAKRLEDNPDSQAAKIYKGYADDLKVQAADLARNGLSMGNRRALTDLRRRYQSEIGMLDLADTAMREEQKRRVALSSKDPSMLYATQNLNIDDFLEGKNPNLYNVSGNDLYTKGATMGKAASSRMYEAGDAGSTLGGLYRNWREVKGVSQESIVGFMNSAAVQQEVDNILQAEGVTGNLTGAEYQKARQQVLNGIYSGIVYDESNKPVRDASQPSYSEQLARERWEEEKKDLDIARRLKYKYDDAGNVIGYNTDMLPQGYTVDPNTGRLKTSRSAPQSAEEKAQQKAENAKQKALLKLDKGTLGHNEGFDVTFGDDRHHYNYIGALSSHRGKWYHGALGEDNPGHGGWGVFSSSNVENAWGNFSAEGSDSKDMRVLSPDEIAQLINNDPDILEAINERVKAAGITGDPDIQLIEVPNEKDSNKKGYLIAVH